MFIDVMIMQQVRITIVMSYLIRLLITFNGRSLQRWVNRLGFSGTLVSRFLTV
jgi:hypothetical protein